MIRVMCSGRVDLEFIFRSFARGQDGVFIGGCKLNECNYITHGNYDALGNTYMAKKIMQHIGLNPERLHIAFMSGGDGNILAEVVDEFSKKIKKIGPLGRAEGMDAETLRLKLESVRKIIGYLRLVERERLRIGKKSEEGYREFFTGADFDRLFDELVVSKLTMSQVLLLLRDRPLSTGKISEILRLSPSEVSRYMNTSSRQGLVRYDTKSNCYALA